MRNAMTITKGGYGRFFYCHAEMGISYNFHDAY